MGRFERLGPLLDTAERHARAGRFGRAVFFYRKVLALTQDGESERELAHARLADLHLGLGQADRALPHARRALALSGGEPDYQLLLGGALLELGRLEEAVFHLSDALTSPVRSTEACAALARAVDGLGDRHAAGRLARRAAAAAPGDRQYRALARSLADA